MNEFRERALRERNTLDGVVLKIGKSGGRITRGYEYGDYSFYFGKIRSEVQLSDRAFNRLVDEQMIDREGNIIADEHG